jgi:hypothetical protein
MRPGSHDVPAGLVAPKPFFEKAGDFDLEHTHVDEQGRITGHSVTTIAVWLCSECGCLVGDRHAHKTTHIDGSSDGLT